MPSVSEFDLTLPDGRNLHVYDTGPSSGPTVYWHHGTPNVGSPPVPLFAASDALGIRWVAHDRPGYGSSSPQPGRKISSVAADVSSVADELGLSRCAMMGHSGGGPHALACAALLPSLVAAVAIGASPAPLDSPGLDWFAGMAEANVASFRASTAGRPAKEAYEANAPADADIGFAPADFAALEGDWSWFMPIVTAALEGGPGPMIDDDLAYVAPWGFSVSSVTAPVYVFHGAADRMIPPAHGEWLAKQCPTAELRILPEEGHVSVLRIGPEVLQWLAARS